MENKLNQVYLFSPCTGFFFFFFSSKTKIYFPSEVNSRTTILQINITSSRSNRQFKTIFQNGISIFKATFQIDISKPHFKTIFQNLHMTIKAQWCSANASMTRAVSLAESMPTLQKVWRIIPVQLNFSLSLRLIRSAEL